jgi:HAD superfamily hydrolase (TIGR01490 family)
VDASIEAGSRGIAAFFDLDKTIISRSSTLAFGPSFYRHGLISRGQAVRTAFGHLVFRLGGADHQRMERIRSEVGALCQGWQAAQVSDIVSRNLDEIILPRVYAEAHQLITRHRASGQDVVIVSSSGQEMVGPIGAWLGAAETIATRMAVADGRYTGEMEFWAYGEAKASRVRELALLRGYWLPDCYAYSDSITDLPLLEAVGHPHAVNPDRALRRIARQRCWPVLSFGTFLSRPRAGGAGFPHRAAARPGARASGRISAVRPASAGVRSQAAARVPAGPAARAGSGGPASAGAAAGPGGRNRAPVPAGAGSADQAGARPCASTPPRTAAADRSPGIPPVQGM